MIYLPPIATAPKWWPDRRALATGFAVVGLGLGSFLWAHWAPDHYRLGLAVCVLVLRHSYGPHGDICSLPLRPPAKGWKPAGWTPPAPPVGAPKVTRDYTHDEAIRTPQFWLLYLSYFCGSFAGLMVIGHIAGHGRDAGLTPMVAAGAISCLGLRQCGHPNPYRYICR